MSFLALLIAHRDSYGNREGKAIVAPGQAKEHRPDLVAKTDGVGAVPQTLCLGAQTYERPGGFETKP